MAEQSARTSFNSARAVQALKRREAERLAAHATPAQTDQDATAAVAVTDGNAVVGGGDDEWRATTIDDDDEVYTDHYVQPLPLPSSSAQVLKGYNRHQQEKNKENRNDTVAIPSRPQHLIQRQSNAQRVQFDEGLESQSTSSQGTVNPPVGRIARGAKRARNVVEGGDEDEQELLLSQDQGFEEMRQPLGLESRRRGSGRGVPASKRPPTYHPSQMTQEAEAEDAEEAEEVEGVQLTRRVPSTSINQSSPRITRGPSLATDVDGDPIDFKKINELAKRSAASKAPRKVQTRKAWSNESTNRLVEFIENDQFGTCWSRIDAQNDPLLEGRGQVGLKDKARNIKMEFLKARTPLPLNFEDVRLNRKQIDALQSMGIAYEQ